MKSIFIALLILSSVMGFSQQTTPNTDYLKKSKHQKTAAWILMGGGVLSTGLGVAGSGVNPDYGDGGLNTSGGTVFLVTGLVAVGASIPLFIASSKNKKRANSVGVKMERLPVLQQKNIATHSYPALSLKISI